MRNVGTNQNRSLYFAIVKWNRFLGGHGKGVGKPVLPWKDKFNEVSRAFQLRLETWVRKFLGIRLELRTGRIYLI